MRALPLLVLLATASACKAEDDGRTVTPPGDGNGGNGNDINTSSGNDSNSGTGTLTRKVCVVLDLEDPFACPDIADARDVLIKIVGTTATAISDATGTFTIDTTTATSTSARRAAIAGSAVVRASAVWR